VPLCTSVVPPVHRPRRWTLLKALPCTTAVQSEGALGGAGGAGVVFSRVIRGSPCAAVAGAASREWQSAVAITMTADYTCCGEGFVARDGRGERRGHGLCGRHESIARSTMACDARLSRRRLQ